MCHHLLERISCVRIELHHTLKEIFELIAHFAAFLELAPVHLGPISSNELIEWIRDLCLVEWSLLEDHHEENDSSSKKICLFTAV